MSKIKDNPRYFYSFAKKFGKTKSSVSPLRDKDGNLVDDPKIKAEILQAQYKQVFSDPEVVNVDECLSNVRPELGENDTLKYITFTEDDIVNALSELDPYSAAPEGDIPAKILSACKKTLARPLLLMWKKSLEEGIIPPSLKDQTVTPVFKTGNRTSPANYRPVSLGSGSFARQVVSATTST